MIVFSIWAFVHVSRSEAFPFQLNIPETTLKPTHTSYSISSLDITIITIENYFLFNAVYEACNMYKTLIITILARWLIKFAHTVITYNPATLKSTCCMLLDWQVATDYRNENSLLNSLAGAGPGRAGQYSEGGDSGGGRPALRPQLCPAQSSQSGTKQRNA